MCTKVRTNQGAKTTIGGVECRPKGSCILGRSLQHCTQVAHRSAEVCTQRGVCVSQLSLRDIACTQTPVHFGLCGIVHRWHTGVLKCVHRGESVRANYL